MFLDLSLRKSQKNISSLHLEALEIRIVPVADPTNGIFVENTFNNILSRSPNAGELVEFTSVLDTGYSRAEFVSDLWMSEAHRTIQITQMYNDFLERDLTAEDDLAGKINRMNANAVDPENQELKTIFLSQEYAGLHSTNTDFVTSLYRLVDHQPNFQEVAGHVAALETYGANVSGGKAAVVDAFLSGIEYEFNCVVSLYRTVLHRNPDGKESVIGNNFIALNYSSPLEEILRISASPEGQAQGNIEQVYVSVTAPSDNIKEGELAFFTVTLSRPASKVVSINYVTVSGQAQPSNDYVFENGKLVFARGETTKTVGIETMEDFVEESAETFGFSLTASFDVSIPGSKEAWALPPVYKATLGASAGDAQQEQISAFMRKIRSVETFSDPLNPGQIVSGLVPNGFPNPDAINNSNVKTSGTKGLATYPGDARNTPGAYQVDLANMNNVFGVWGGQGGSEKNSNPENTQFAFSKATLETYFGIKVDGNGFITEIGPEAASIFLQNDSLANSSSFNKASNPLIGQNIQNFKYEQLSLFLAGRLADDSTAGPTSLGPDTRIATDSVQNRVDDIQLQAAKTFVYNSYISALKNNASNEADFGPGGFNNVEALFGSTLKITSSTTAFGVKAGQVFLGTLNPSFLNGYGYVGGYFGLRPVLSAILAADANGTSTLTINATHITVTRTLENGIKVFSFDKTPVNVSAEYPSFFHYGALLSQFKDINMASGAHWAVSTTPFTLGYATTGTQVSTQIIGTGTLPTTAPAYQVGYTGLGLNQTMTVNGAGAYNITPEVSSTAPNVVVTPTGYVQTGNNNQSVSSDQKIDMSAYGTNYATASTHFFYVDSSADGQVYPGGRAYSRTDCPSISFGLYFYYIPTASTVAEAQTALGDSSFFGGTNASAFRVSVANCNILGDAPADKFVFVSTPVVDGTGLVDASAATGPIFINVDKSLNRMNLGSGRNQIMDSNTTATTYFINSGMTDNQISASIQGFEVGTVSDVLNLTLFGSGLTNVEVADFASFNNLSDTPGSSVANFYDQYSYFAKVIFKSADKVYSIQVGTTSDAEIIDFKTLLLNSIVKT